MKDKTPEQLAFLVKAGTLPSIRENALEELVRRARVLWLIHERDQAHDNPIGGGGHE